MCPDCVNDRFAERKPAGGIANQRGKYVRLPQRNANGCTQGFLTAT
jgi:hypothetical protein